MDLVAQILRLINGLIELADHAGQKDAVLAGLDAYLAVERAKIDREIAAKHRQDG